MGISLDITTMVFTLALGHLFSGLLGAAYLVQHKRDSALYLFFLSRICSILGCVLLMNPGWTVGWWGSIRHVLILAAEVLQVSAFFQIKGYRLNAVRWGYPLVVTAVAALILPVNILFKGNGGAQIGIISLLVTAIWVYPIGVLLLGRGATLLHRAVGTIYALGLIPRLLRAELGFRLQAGLTNFSGELVNTLFFASLFPVMLAGNVGFILISKEKSDFELTRAATYDELTGLYNRGTFLRLAQRSMVRCAKRSIPLSYLMLDIDHFKNINDHFGHQLGDVTLAHFAALCQQHLRERDMAGRLGGEEFALLLTGLDEGDTLSVAERLRHAVEEAGVDAGQNRMIHFTVSIGVVNLIPNQSTTLDQLYTWSDSALYAAKKGGRNQVRLAQPVMK